MDTIETARPLLDAHPRIAAWYTGSDGPEEFIRYANPRFSEIFGLPVAEILEKKRYHLVNPPGTPENVIERYKEEDLEAIEHGHFLQRAPFEPGTDIIVLKIRFARGMLGLFKIVPSEPPVSPVTISDLDADFKDVLRSVRVDLLQ